MPIVIARTGDSNPQYTPITQEQREALWAAFVTGWVKKNEDKFAEMIAADKSDNPSE